MTFTSVRAGVIYQPTTSGSPITSSYGTSFNPSLESLTLTSGQQNLDPEKNRSFELGAQMGPLRRQPVAHVRCVPGREDQCAHADLDRRLRARSAMSACDGVEIGAAGRITPDWQRRSAATRISTPRSSRRRRSTGRKARCPRIRRATAVNVWTTYDISREWRDRRRAHLHVGALREQHQRRHRARTSRAGRCDARLSSAALRHPLNVFNVDRQGPLSTR